MIDPTKPITAEIINDLHEKLENFDGEFEALINTAGHHYIPNEQRILKMLKNKGEDIPIKENGDL